MLYRGLYAMDEHRVYLHAGWDVFFHLSEHIVGPYFFGDVSLHWNDLAWIVGRADIGKMAYRRHCRPYRNGNAMAF